MKRVRLSLRTLHSETEDPVIELAPNETIHAITAGLVSGHPTFDVVIATDLTPPQRVPPRHDGIQSAARVPASPKRSAARSPVRTTPSDGRSGDLD